MYQIRLSESPTSINWLAQFKTALDRALAKQLLDQLKLVSSREFETSIEGELIRLQKRLKKRIAVYPIVPPVPDGIVGYDQFEGAIALDESNNRREIGRRRKYGSEDRVGHILAKLQDRFKLSNGVSLIECSPTIKQLKTQKIQHIVFVDDVCGSGKRVHDYWKSVPRSIKSLLSFGRIKLWILMYAVTPSGKRMIRRAMPNFPIVNLITVLPDADLLDALEASVISLCERYSERLGWNSGSALGYRRSACSIVFEHGCPNNLPHILWGSGAGWRALFPDRSIPIEIRSYFDRENDDRAPEVLWKVNQPNLALSLINALDHVEPIKLRQRLTLAMLGLLTKGVMKKDLARRLLIKSRLADEIFNEAKSVGLCSKEGKLTPLGEELLSRFRDHFKSTKKAFVAAPTSFYYPHQCEGETL